MKNKARNQNLSEVMAEFYESADTDTLKWDSQKCLQLINDVTEENENFMNLYEGLTKAILSRNEKLRDKIKFLIAVVNDHYMKTIEYKEELNKLKKPKEEKSPKKKKAGKGNNKK